MRAMSTLRRFVPCLSLVALSCGNAAPRPIVATPEPVPQPQFNGLEGFLELDEARAILDHAATIHVEASTEGLEEAELEVITELMAVGEILHDLYERQLHGEARVVREHLASYRPRDDAEREQLEALRSLHWLFDGPIARTLDNERVAIAPIEAYAPQRNIYPSSLEAAELSAAAGAHPEAELLGVRTLVRRRTAEALEQDREALAGHPALSAFHPSLARRLEDPPDPGALYAVPYALGYADELAAASTGLFRAATAARTTDPALADFLEQRARDLLSNDYEAGDAVWITAPTGRLNAQIGAYETYDDHLMGQRAFFSLSILLRDAEASRTLEEATVHLPTLQGVLPGGPDQAVRSRIPIGIYDVLADYGQSRGANTASILPNEAHITERYGRIILIRRNIIQNPAVLDIARRRFEAIVAEVHHGELAPTGNFDRTVFHEVGHYLGPSRTADGRLIGEALGNLQNCIEELKSDLLSLWLMPRLVELGVLDEARRRAAYAAGVLRVLVPTEPSRDQAYRTMQLMQQRFFLEHGLLRFEGERGLFIDFDRFPEVVEQMLTEVLALQRAGDRSGAEAYVDRWAQWNEQVQGVIGEAVDQASPRFRLVEYAAFGR